MPAAKYLPKSARSSTKTSLFDFLKDITIEKKNILNYDNQSAYSKYMICRFLSMHNDYLPIVDLILNKQQAHLSNQEFHKLCLAIIPKNNIRLNYVKGSSKIKENKEDLEYIAKYFKVSMNDAMEYYEICGEDLANNIKKMHGIIEE